MKRRRRDRAAQGKGGSKGDVPDILRNRVGRSRDRFCAVHLRDGLVDADEMSLFRASMRENGRSSATREFTHSITADRLRRLAAFVARRIRQPANTEDCLSEALVRVQSYQSGHEPRQLDALIVKTALNVEIDEFRRQSRWGSGVDISECLDERDGAPIQDEILMMRQRLARVKAGFAQLSPRTREALSLRRIEGLSYREIAQRMQISESAVEKHVAKGVHFLIEWSDGW